MPEPSHLANLNLFNVREQQFLNLSVTWLSQQYSKFDIAQGKTLIFCYSLLPGWFSYYLLNTLTFTTPTATSPSQAPSPSYPHPWTRPLFKKFLNFFKWGSDSLLRSSFTKSNEESSKTIIWITIVANESTFSCWGVSLFTLPGVAVAVLLCRLLTAWQDLSVTWPGDLKHGVHRLPPPEEGRADWPLPVYLGVFQ